MEISAPGVLVSVTQFGEGDAIGAVFTEQHGIYRGLVRGAQSRKNAAIWQTGNLVECRWIARLADQLGTLSGDIVHASAALAMADPPALAILRAVCAVADGALPERVPHPAIFRGLLHLVAHVPQGAALLPDLVRWELGLLAELGYGLDLTRCAVTGETNGLAYVSPRTGRAVSAAAAGLWKDRLLPLPSFLADGGVSPEAAAQGLRLTAHFLARNVFAPQNKPLPAARAALS